MNRDDLRSRLASVTADLRTGPTLLILAVLVAIAIAIPVVLHTSGTSARLSSLPPAATVTAPTSSVPSLATTTSTTTVSSRGHVSGPAHNPFGSGTVTTSQADVGTSPARASDGTGSTGTHSSSSDGSTSSSASSSSATGSTHSGSVTTSGSQGTTATCPAGFHRVNAGGQRFCVEHVCPNGTVSAALNGRLGCLAPGRLCHSDQQSALVAYGYTCVAGRLRVRTKLVRTRGPYANSEVALSLLQPAVTRTPTVFHDLARDQLLPTDSGAFGAFLGVRTDGRTAVFLLGAGVSVSGQGRCALRDGLCRFLTLEPGQVVVLSTGSASSGGTTFRLRYLRVRRVLSDGSLVSTDVSGASAVRRASASIPTLETIRYGRFSGLLSIALGSTVSVTR